MKRKITLLFMAVFLVLSCTISPFGPELISGHGYNVIAQAAENDEDIDTETLKNYLTQLADALSGYTDDQIAQVEAQLQAQVDADRDNKEAATLLSFVKDWQEISAEMGTVTGHGDFTYEKTGKSLTTTLELETTGRDAKIVAVYKIYDLSRPTAVNAELIYTFSETIGTAALNVVIGIVTVFIILIIIALVIYAFNIIPYIQKKLEKKKSNELTDDEADDQITIVSGHQKSHESTAFNGDADDEELIAVIAAAISASTGLSTDDFVVRSIRRR